MSIDDVRFLASDQFGLITTAQAENLGVSRVTIHRMMKQGELRLSRRGVYSFESSPLATHEEVRAAWLSLSPSRTVAEQIQDVEAPVICTTSAAAVLGIGDFQTEQHEFFVSSRKQSRAEDIHIRVRALSPDDIQVVDGLKVTTPTRIVVDLLNELRELEHIGALIVDAVRLGYEIDWKRIRNESSNVQKSYGLPAETIFFELLRVDSIHEASIFKELVKQISPDFSEIFSNFCAQKLSEIRELGLIAIRATEPAKGLRFKSESKISASPDITFSPLAPPLSSGLNTAKYLQASASTQENLDQQLI